MATLGGKHAQAQTARELTFSCSYEVVGEVEIAYAATITEGRAFLGLHEATLHFDPSGISAKSAVRMNLLKHLDQTSFGEGKLPDPKWIGWYGPYQ
jgi:hypothetical protein